MVAALGLHAVVYVVGRVTRTTFEEIVIWLNVRSQIDHLTCLQLPDSIERYRIAVMVGTLKMTIQANLADIFVTFSRIG